MYLDAQNGGHDWRVYDLDGPGYRDNIFSVDDESHVYQEWKNPQSIDNCSLKTVKAEKYIIIYPDQKFIIINAKFTNIDMCEDEIIQLKKDRDELRKRLKKLHEPG